MRALIRGAVVVASLALVTSCGAGGQSTTTVTVTSIATVTVTETATPADTATSGDTFSMTGTLDLYGDGSNFRESGEECAGIDGYDDIRDGAQVTIYSAAGTIAGVGAIDDTTYEAGLCTMTWTASEIPAGQGPYQYEISHRGKITITEADARAGNAAASLGT